MIQGMVESFESMVEVRVEGMAYGMVETVGGTASTRSGRVEVE